MMKPLRLDDIRIWLIENRDEFQKAKAQEFPPLDNKVYWMYFTFHQLMEYYTFRYRCDKALRRLIRCVEGDFQKLKSWVKAYEILGSQQLLMFEIDYFDWEENVNGDLMKIREGLYTEREPFRSILYFCESFALLFWSYEIHKTTFSETEQRLITEKTRQIIQRYYTT